MHTSKHSEVSKKKISLAMSGKKKTLTHRKRLSEAKLLHPVRYWLGKTRSAMSGKNNPMWNGGTSRTYKEGYYSTEYIRWRLKVFERDGYRCQVCDQVGGYLTAHHIKSFAHFPKLRFEITNGITLCEDCHSLTDNYKGRNKITKQINKNGKL